jgi:secondary thiamine-phosphate synthase enzyme
VVNLEKSAMETFAPAPAGRDHRLRIATVRPTEFIDVTDAVQALVAESGIRVGIANIQSLHTTAAIVLNEHEPLLLSDFTTLLERTAPSDRLYEHDDAGRRTVNLSPGERINGHAHCRALLLPPSACLNIVDGSLQLGRWQRVFLAELDGPRIRDLSVLLLGGSGR